MVFNAFPSPVFRSQPARSKPILDDDPDIMLFCQREDFTLCGSVYKTIGYLYSIKCSRFYCGFSLTKSTGDADKPDFPLLPCPVHLFHYIRVIDDIQGARMNLVKINIFSTKLREAGFEKLPELFWRVVVIRTRFIAPFAPFACQNIFVPSSRQILSNSLFAGPVSRCTVQKVNPVIQDAV